MINIFFGFWRKFSIVLVTLIIFFCYKSLPDPTAIAHDEFGKPLKFITKQTFFYWSTGVVFVFNLLFTILKNQVLKIELSKLSLLENWAAKPKAFSKLLTGWFNAFCAVVNTYLVFVFLGISNVNSNKGQVLDFNYNLLLITGLLLLMSLIFFLPLRLLFSTPSSSNE